ncbi:MAG TPA: exosortase U [Planctomycetaceae bacterium]
MAPPLRQEPGDAGEPGQIVRPALWAAAAVTAAAAIGPLLVEFAERTWASEHYRFGPLLLLAVAAIGIRRYRDGEFGRGRGWARAGLWGFGLLLGAAAVFAISPFAAAIAVLALAVAAIYEHGGGPLLRRLAPAWALLWLAVPPPFGGDRWLVTSLQKVASRWASGVLDLGGVRHLADGVAIRLPERDFFVDEACSGVHSLFAALAFAGVFAVATRRGLGRTLLLLTAAVFWVVVGNVLRICAVVVLSTKFGLPVTEGLGHELVGIAAFALIVALVASTDRFFLFLLPERKYGLIEALRMLWRREEAADLPPPETPARPRRGWLSPVAVGTAFAVLAVVGPTLPTARPATHQSQLALTENFKPLDADDLPAEWGGWRREGFKVIRRDVGDEAGELSRVWVYRKGRLAAAVSVDGPYDGWHDLTWCYDGQGYAIDSTRDLSAPGHAAPHTELRLSNELGRHGLVLYAAYTESDRPVAPPRAARRDRLTSRIVWALQGRLGPSEVERGERVYQVQVFAESGLGFTDAERNDLEALFQTMRSAIAGRDADAPRGEAARGPAGGMKA